jgi:exodeoxyribonuclease V alpha subunit
VSAVAFEPFSPELALGAPAPLAAFNAAGVLSAADVHVAVTLGRMAGVTDGIIALAVALAVRAPRLGHVFVDLASVRDTVAVEREEVPVDTLPWPEPDAWIAAVAARPELVASGAAAEDPDAVLPLRLLGSRLYLDRYWREERALAQALLSFSAAPVRPVALDALAAIVQRLFASGDVRQRAAAAAAALRGLTVIAGGPGTGKTTTVARACAVLFEQAAGAGEPPPLIALCAPTGKAAARLQEAVHDEAGRLEVAGEIRAELLGLRASTIHRLLGWRPHGHGRFRHDAGNRLPHDVVIVDETSMVPLTLMVALLGAVRADARAVLVGDPDQLTAVEAGAVLRDIVGPAAAAPQLGPGARALLELVAGGDLGGATAAAGGIGDGIVVLERGHRFGAGIGALADAVRRGDADRAVAAAGAAGAGEIDWIRLDPGGERDRGMEAALEPLRVAASDAGTAVLEAARAGDGAAALAALGGFRLLCAHRHGDYGVAAWSAQVERWLAEAVEGFVPGDLDRAGRPLLVTRNDYELRLYNGDTGVVIADGEGGVTAAFERDGRLARFAPSRLEAVDTLYAMTIHKSQGSQFDVAAVLAPDPSSRLLSRELLYTAITRARRRLILICTEETLRAAVQRPVARATGLSERLWLAK